MDNGIAECDVRGCVARDSREPTVEEAHIGNFDECGLPQQEAMKPKVDVKRGRALFHRIGALEFIGEFVEEILPSLSLVSWTLLQSTDIRAIDFADCFTQGPPNNPREWPPICPSRFDLSTDEKSLVLGPLPPQGRLEAAEI